MAETSEHNIDPEGQLIAIEIETRSPRKYRAPGTEVKSLIPKVAVAIFSSNANDIIERILNSATRVPTGQNIPVSGTACVGHAAEENAELMA